MFGTAAPEMQAVYESCCVGFSRCWAEVFAGGHHLEVRVGEEFLSPSLKSVR